MKVKRARTFLVNTVALTTTSLVMRALGVCFSVYLAGVIGAAGMGLYQLTMSAYTFAVTLACSGARLATTRLVVEELSTVGGAGVQRVTRCCLMYSAFFGLLAAVLLFWFAEPVSSGLLGDPRPALSLRVLAVSLPFLAMGGVLGGYFNARRRALLNAGVQIGEQLVRVALSVILLKWLLPMGMEYGCVALVSASCIAEATSFTAYLVLYREDVRSRPRKKGKNPLGRLLKIAIPDAISSYVRSGLATAEQMLIPAGLKRSGQSSENALAAYGTIGGMVVPILLFPSALLDSLARLLVPELAECLTRDHRVNARYMVSRVLQITMLFSIGVMGVMFSFAGELGMAIYKRSDVALYLKALSPVIPFLYIDVAVDSMLKGLGQQASSMRYNIIDSLFSVMLILWLLPRYAIIGYLITIYAGQILNFGLSIRRLQKVTAFQMKPFSWILTPLLCITGAISAARLLFHGTVPTLVGLILQIAVAAALYFGCLTAMAVITDSDRAWFRSIFKNG